MKSAIDDKKAKGARAKRKQPEEKNQAVTAPAENCGTKHAGGRPTKYETAFAAVAKMMASLGATDYDIALELGVDTTTVWRWRSRYPDFCNALKEGKDGFDDRVERALAQRAVGYSYHSEKVFNYEGSIIRAPIVEHVPPDVGACKLWLSNRRPDTWRDKQEVAVKTDAFAELLKLISEGKTLPQGSQT